jgi:hypothetical protein
MIARKHLDEVPLWRGDHVAVRQMAEDFARYLYLPRLAGPEVLVQAMRDGLALLTWQTDTFAYAESFDDAAGRYRGLRAGQGFMLSAEDTGLIVKPEVARRQLDAETPQPGSFPHFGSHRQSNSAFPSSFPPQPCTQLAFPCGEAVAAALAGSTTFTLTSRCLSC